MDDDKLAALVKWKRWADVLEKDQVSQKRLTLADGSFAPISRITNLSWASRNPPSTSHRESRRGDGPDSRSFKYVHGSTTLDTRRPAAYTDRVLYRVPTGASALEEERVKTGKYTSHEILWSDHRPVSCSFEVAVRVPDEEKRKVDLGVVRSELDKLDEEWAPAIELDHNEVEFGDARYALFHTHAG